jgi:hypothetical protein
MLVDCIRRLVHFGPSCWPSRVDALDQIYCVLGNGYAWVDGALVVEDGCGFTEVDEPLTRMAQDRAHFDTSIGMVAEWLDERESEIRYAHEHEDAIADGSVDYVLRSEFYPLGSGSNLLHVPDDVQPDYLAGALETISLILAWETLHPDDKRAVRNASKASKALADLARRFPGSVLPDVSRAIGG